VKTLYLIKKYSDKVPAKILAEYKEPDKYLWVNTDDKDLIPIRITLPDPPEYHLIDGFGLPAKEQYWRPPKLPRKLKELQKKYETIDEMWDEIEKNKDVYEEEIKFIKKQWYHRLNGYWFFINGKPTYIDGWHYFYCAWWNIDVGLPQYRDRDRKFFIFARYIYNETKTFKYTDEFGNAIKGDDDEWYEMIDTGGRVFYGFNYPKHRREGATYKAECINYDIITTNIGAWGGIQSQDEAQARKCFMKHLVSPWRKLPFFFKPNYEGSTAPKSELSFSPPSKRLSSKGSLFASEYGLESMINFEDSKPTAYDGDKLYFHHDDEVGKLTEGVSCWDRHLIVKECLVMGSEIIGFTIKTSTVGEMEKGGGRAFKHQCEMSNFFQRTPNGQTRSGLATLFIPAYEGLQGFIDKYGQSVIDTPTKEQAEFIGRNIGAKQYLLNRRKGYLDAGDFDGLAEEIRLYPMKFTECFRTATKSSGFNMAKLESRIDELRFSRNLPVRGDFLWKNERYGEVIFVPNKNGKFFVSQQLGPDEANRRYWDETTETWMPGNASWGVAGADPFKFNKTEGYRKSKGAGAVIRKARLKNADFSMKRKFVCTYENRTYDKHEYADDMLRMCLYYGVPMFPEINVDLIWDYFETNGYGGFLLYKYDPKTGQISKTPGANTSEKIKQDIFTEFMNFIENEIDEETHIEILEQCRDISGPEEMKFFDLFTAAGYALLGTLSLYNEIIEIEQEELDLGNFVKKRKYN